MKRVLIESGVDQFPKVFRCECGKSVVLWFNGGELDTVICNCGRHYALEIAKVDLVELKKGGNYNAE